MTKTKSKSKIAGSAGLKKAVAKTTQSTPTAGSKTVALKTAGSKTAGSKTAASKKVGAKAPAPTAKKALLAKKAKPVASEKVQLSARKPEKSAPKKAASKPAPKAAPKSNAPAANNKIVSTLKNLLGGAKAPKKAAETVKAAPKAAAKSAEKSAAKKPEAKAAVETKAAAKEKAKPAAAAPKTSANAIAAAAQGVAPKAGAAKTAEAKTPGSSVLTKTGKPVRKAVSKAGSGLTAHGLGDSCREVACENMATTGPYCRMHYIKNWRRIKNKEKILSENRLNGFIEELVSKYPEKYIEAIRADLASEKEFAKVISDLDLDESVDEFEGEGGENVENIIDTIRRDFDEDTEGF